MSKPPPTYNQVTCSAEFFTYPAAWWPGSTELARSWPWTSLRGDRGSQGLILGPPMISFHSPPFWRYIEIFAFFDPETATAPISPYLPPRISADCSFPRPLVTIRGNQISHTKKDGGSAILSVLGLYFEMIKYNKRPPEIHSDHFFGTMDFLPRNIHYN